MATGDRGCPSTSVCDRSCTIPEVPPSATSTVSMLERLANGPGVDNGTPTPAPRPQVAPGLGSTSAPPSSSLPAPSGPSNTVGADTLSVDSKGRDIATLVRELFIRAREARRPLVQQWKSNYRFLNNRQYQPGASPWEEEPAVASIWPTIASATAWMTDQRPEIEVTPTAESFSPYWDYYQSLANDMNTLLGAAFTTYMLDAEITKALWDVHTYGVAYLKTVWEPWLADGLGDAVFRRVDPFTIYPDPHARSPHELSYIIEAKVMTAADADRAWPGAWKKIAADLHLEDSDEAPHRLSSQANSRQPRVALGALAGNTSGVWGRSSTDTNKPTDTPVVSVLECWIRGYRTEATDDPDVTKVYDDWRCIVVCGNAVLMDTPASEINAYGTHPYDRLVLFDVGEWYGPCIVELLTPIQRTINWLLGSFNRNIYLMGNPVLVEDPRSASRNKRFTNRPGQRLEGSLGAVGWMNPPQIHPQMSIQLVQYYEGKIESISGLSAMVRGFSPTGRNSTGVLDSVQDAAFVRVRASLRELERVLRGQASKMAATVSEFYTEPRMQSIIGPDGQRTYLALQERHFYADTTTGDDGLPEMIPMRFSLTADAGSQLPTSRQARAAEAKHLFTIGAIDVYEVLKAMQWPSYANVAQRVMQQQAVMGGNGADTRQKH